MISCLIYLALSPGPRSYHLDLTYECDSTITSGILREHEVILARVGGLTDQRGFVRILFDNPDRVNFIPSDLGGLCTDGADIYGVSQRGTYTLNARTLGQRGPAQDLVSQGDCCRAWKKSDVTRDFGEEVATHVGEWDDWGMGELSFEGDWCAMLLNGNQQLLLASDSHKCLTYDLPPGKSYSAALNDEGKPCVFDGERTLLFPLAEGHNRMERVSLGSYSPGQPGSLVGAIGNNWIIAFDESVIAVDTSGVVNVIHEVGTGIVFVQVQHGRVLVGERSCQAFVYSRPPEATCFPRTSRGS